jgi:hypothetical protein
MTKCIFGEYSECRKVHSVSNVKGKTCSLSPLLLLGGEYFVFQFAIQKYKDSDIQKYKFALLFCMGVNLGPSH